MKPMWTDVRDSADVMDRLTVFGDGTGMADLRVGDSEELRMQMVFEDAADGSVTILPQPGADRYPYTHRVNQLAAETRVQTGQWPEYWTSNLGS